MNISALIKEAQAANPWDFGNEVLYSLCRENPHHKRPEKVLAKIWLIGRSYAAAIERRRNRSDTGDDFYVSKVAPMIINSDIDKWISRAKKQRTTESLVDAHHMTTQLFNDISGLEKRSLASKYLHFHAPDIFYIYDTRAVKGLSLLKEFSCRASTTSGEGDNEYRKFVEKCIALRATISSSHKKTLSPRQLDNLLLLASKAET